MSRSGDSGKGTQSQTPRADRPEMPGGYGVAANGETRAWSWARERLEKAHNYWVATTRPDGRPHSMPVWGLWLENAFYFGTDQRSRKARNLSLNQSTVVHLESGDETVILEGKATTVESADISTLDAPYAKKYGMKITQAPGILVVYRITPIRVLGWEEKTFPAGATRWTF